MLNKKTLHDEIKAREKNAAFQELSEHELRAVNGGASGVPGLVDPLSKYAASGVPGDLAASGVPGLPVFKISASFGI